MKAIESLPRVNLIYSYWSNPEAKRLFCQLKREINGACLVQREQMLAQLILDDGVLLVLVDNANRIIDISIK